MANCELKELTIKVLQAVLDNCIQCTKRIIKLGANEEF
jgi:hypothetical protein